MGVGGGWREANSQEASNYVIPGLGLKLPFGGQPNYLREKGLEWGGGKRHPERRRACAAEDRQEEHHLSGKLVFLETKKWQEMILQSMGGSDEVEC
jgi:hypothetical protein